MTTIDPKLQHEISIKYMELNAKTGDTPTDLYSLYARSMEELGAIHAAAVQESTARYIETLSF